MIKLTTERLQLRQFKTEDIDELFEIIQEEEIKRFLPGVYTASREELEKMLSVYVNANFKDDIYLAITDKSTGKLIGALILVRLFKHNMEISYFMRKENREMGLMIEAMHAFVKWYARGGYKNNIMFAISKNNNSSLFLCARMKELKIPIFNVAESDTTLYYMIRPWCIS